MFSASSNVIVSDIVKFLLIFTINGFSLRVEHSIGCNDSKLFWLSGYNFELNWLKVASDKEEVALLNGAVSIFEVGDEICFGEITLDAFNGVGEG